MWVQGTENLCKKAKKKDDHFIKLLQNIIYYVWNSKNHLSTHDPLLTIPAAALKDARQMQMFLFSEEQMWRVASSHVLQSRVTERHYCSAAVLQCITVHICDFVFVSQEQLQSYNN